MSVVKNKRKPSQFEVFHHLYKMRRDITDLLLRDFGYSRVKADNYLSKQFGGKSYADLTESDQARYDKLKARNDSFNTWFINDERQAIVDCLRTIVMHVHVANSIYPTCEEEYAQRRLHQDEAICQCYRLLQEMQYAIETLPVNVDTYLRFAEEIQTEINLIKGWRKVDNRFRPNRAPSESLPTSAANFANVNSNGNCNNNNASNVNGVRPDFDPTVKKP